jgi:hypothetical protein
MHRLGNFQIAGFFIFQPDLLLFGHLAIHSLAMSPLPPVRTILLLFASVREEKFAITARNLLLAGGL